MWMSERSTGLTRCCIGEWKRRRTSSARTRSNARSRCRIERDYVRVVLASFDVFDGGLLLSRDDVRARHDEALRPPSPSRASNRPPAGRALGRAGSIA